jgi:hypothetical protein
MPKKSKRRKEEKAKDQLAPALDFHEQWHENNCLHEYRSGCANCVAGHPIQRMAGRNLVGIVFWRFDLGNFLW